MNRKRTSSQAKRTDVLGRPSLGNVFASRSVSTAKEGRASRLWLEMGKTRHLSWLMNPENYPKGMPEATARKLHGFVLDWVNKRTVLETRLDRQSKQMESREHISQDMAYKRAVQGKVKDIERRFNEKVALDQLSWVLFHQKMLRGRGKKIDSLEPGPNIKRLAQELRRAKDKAVAFVSLAEHVSKKIELISAHSAIAEAYYGLPTAEETLRLNGIIVGSKKGKPAWGCGMMCDVMNAVLTHAKWENYHIRTIDRDTNPHSVVLAKVPGTKMWLLADPYSDGHMFLYGVEGFKGSNVVSQVGEYLGEEITKLKKRSKWRKGRCQRNLVRNFGEYDGGR